MLNDGSKEKPMKTLNEMYKDPNNWTLGLFIITKTNRYSLKGDRQDGLHQFPANPFQ
jgi:hypothetical protein